MYLRGMCAHNVPHINNHALFLEENFSCKLAQAVCCVVFFVCFVFAEIQRSGSNLVFD